MELGRDSGCFLFTSRTDRPQKLGLARREASGYTTPIGPLQRSQSQSRVWPHRTSEPRGEDLLDLEVAKKLSTCLLCRITTWQLVQSHQVSRQPALPSRPPHHEGTQRDGELAYLTVRP